MIANEKYRLIRDPFFTDYSDLSSCNLKHKTERRLHHAQTLIIGSFLIKFADDPFDTQYRDSEDQI